MRSLSETAACAAGSHVFERARADGRELQEERAAALVADLLERYA